MEDLVQVISADHMRTLGEGFLAHVYDQGFDVLGQHWYLLTISRVRLG